MYLQDSNDSNVLTLLKSAEGATAGEVMEDPELKQAFEEGLRRLAEDIVEFHPDLAHVLLGMSEAPNPFAHGQN